MQTLLSTAYFGPTQYYCKIVEFDAIYIEGQENFIKQTYRNRLYILGANGPLSLSIPVEKGRIKKIKIKDILIEYVTDWQKNHWKSIESAYKSSPFFEFYQDDIIGFFEKKYKFLWDLNQEILYKTLNWLDIPEEKINISDRFTLLGQEENDHRYSISPKINCSKDKKFNPNYYQQVFSDKFGFSKNLSILDVVFNEGPNAISVIEKSITH